MSALTPKLLATLFSISLPSQSSAFGSSSPTTACPAPLLRLRGSGLRDGATREASELVMTMKHRFTSLTEIRLAMTKCRTLLDRRTRNDSMPITQPATDGIGKLPEIIDNFAFRSTATRAVLECSVEYCRLRSILTAEDVSRALGLVGAEY